MREKDNPESLQASLSDSAIWHSFKWADLAVLREVGSTEMVKE